jgi:glycosyltransferase involved in cell wall biosynthesis
MDSSDEDRLSALEQHLDALRGTMRAIVTGERENGHRLAALRDSAEYEVPYRTPEPLVSITIPTRDRAEVLRTRSLRSALEQTYENIEVVVVGDAAPPEVEEAVRSFGDSRARYVHRPVRYELEDPRRRWLVGSVLARNEALRAARGDWLVAFDDDDEMHPRHVELLLDAARSRRLEVAYGRFRTLRADGRIFEHGEFPPRFTRFTFQTALYHAGLRFFERQLAAADFDVPNDWFTCDAMLRAGVRFGMVREFVCDLFPSPGSQVVRIGREQADR